MNTNQCFFHITILRSIGKKTGKQNKDLCLALNFQVGETEHEPDSPSKNTQHFGRHNAQLRDKKHISNKKTMKIISL